MKLTINRPNWYRGRGALDSRLLTDVGHLEGEMCCLGFLALACGYTKSEIHDVCNPCDLAHSRANAKKGFKFLLTPGVPGDGVDNSVAGASLMNINDDRELSDAERERQIKEIMAKHKISVTFTDDPLEG